MEPLSSAPGIVVEPRGRSPVGLQEAQRRTSGPPFGADQGATGAGVIEVELGDGQTGPGVEVVVASECGGGEEGEMAPVGADPGGGAGGRVVAGQGGIRAQGNEAGGAFVPELEPG